MSRIEDKLSKIFLNQVPEFLRVADVPMSIVTQGSTTAESRIVTVSSTTGIKIGDRLTHASIAENIFVTHVISNRKLRIDRNSPVTITNGNLTFQRIDGTSNFVKFVEAYFKFLEQDQHPQELLQNARKYGDSEKTIDSLLESFFKQYGDDIPRNLKTDKRTFIKFFKDVHQTKGTEEAYKLLFRVMFDENVTIDYPEKYVFKPSDGNWVRKIIMRVDYTDGPLPYEFVNSKIVGKTSGATAIVENVLKFTVEGYEYYELVLSKVIGTFVFEDVQAHKLVDVATNTISVITARTLPMISAVNVIDGGAGYTTESTVTATHSSGRNSYIKIKNVSETGAILDFDIVEPGVYFFEGEATNIHIETPSMSVAGTVVFLNNVGEMTTIAPHGLRKGQQFRISVDGAETVTVTARIISNSNQIKFDYVHENGEAAAMLSYTNSAVITTDIGFVTEYPGYWADGRSRLSGSMKLQGPLADSPNPNVLYYQPFSYVVKSGVTIDNWRDISKHTVHPAGTQIFGEIELKAEVSSNTNPAGNTEIWDYIGFTADYAGNLALAGTTEFSNSQGEVVSLPITTDLVYYRIGYL